MRIPKRPPEQSRLWSSHATDEKTIYDLLDKVPDGTVEGQYIHWDKLLHLTPPEGLSHRAWWLGLKIRRNQLKAVPLVDNKHAAFQFNLADPLPECMHHIDSWARGTIELPEPVTNPETRDGYIVRSIIEESITSSQLEGASTTREVAKNMIREGRKPRNRSELMIHNNYTTMQNILTIKDKTLSKIMVFDIHRMITDGTLDDPSGAGRFRRDDEDIAVVDAEGEIIHRPPDARELDWRMEEMCRFANGDSPKGFVHPFIRSMILHFWLAYDHPFVDGNGRTARALFYWSMLHYGYWMMEFITISKIILSGPTQYCQAFLHTETDENDLTYFLVYHSNVVKRAIDDLYQYIERRGKQLRKAAMELRGLTILNHRQRDLIDHAIRHPGQTYTIEYHRSGHNVAYETARADLINLTERHLLTKRKIGKIWHFTPVPDLETRLRTIH